MSPSCRLPLSSSAPLALATTPALIASARLTYVASHISSASYNAMPPMFSGSMLTTVKSVTCSDFFHSERNWSLTIAPGRCLAHRRARMSGVRC